MSELPEVKLLLLEHPATRKVKIIEVIITTVIAISIISNLFFNILFNFILPDFLSSFVLCDFILSNFASNFVLCNFILSNFILFKIFCFIDLNLNLIIFPFVIFYIISSGNGNETLNAKWSLKVGNTVNSR